MSAMALDDFALMFGADNHVCCDGSVSRRRAVDEAGTAKRGKPSHQSGDLGRDRRGDIGAELRNARPIFGPCSLMSEPSERRSGAAGVGGEVGARRAVRSVGQGLAEVLRTGLAVATRGRREAGRARGRVVAAAWRGVAAGAGRVGEAPRPGPRRGEAAAASRRRGLSWGLTVHAAPE